MNEEEFKIEKNVPIKRPQKSLLYPSDEIPFEKMEVGDSIIVPITKLIYGNVHPDKNERFRAINSITAYLRRTFPDRKFVYRMDMGTKFMVNTKVPYDKICVRFWRIK